MLLYEFNYPTNAVDIATDGEIIPHPYDEIITRSNLPEQIDDISIKFLVAVRRLKYDCG